MKISYSVVTKPSFLLTPTLIARKTHLFTNPILRIPCTRKNNLIRLIKSSGYSTAERSTTTTTSSESSGSSRLNKKNGNRHSVSTIPNNRPGLLDNKSEKAKNRARVYELLRGLGIVPDELDGLELPVTVEVMKERVDFLMSLGLEVNDINNYPLVLGCSVKKNMIPVLDYLGKVGVRKSMLSEFLRRYPQVLHSSVVVDLAPVVKYLHGLDIKPVDVPRVLEKYPELLGFKLDGTMSTSVAYLVGIGVARRQIGGILARYPEILGMRVGRTIKPFVEYLESLGIPRLAVAKLIEQRPQILGFALEGRVKPNVESLVEFCVRESSVAPVVAQYPEILGLDLGTKLRTQRALLESLVGLGPKEFGTMVEKMPQIVSLSEKSMVKHVEFLKQCGLMAEQVREMVVKCPQLLGLNLDIMRLGFGFFRGEMGRPLEELVNFPAYFTYGLESTVKPRHRKVAKIGMKCSLAWMLNCSDEKFKQRMDYDSIDADEMEDTEESFDMNSLISSEGSESESEYEDSEDDNSDDYV